MPLPKGMVSGGITLLRLRQHRVATGYGQPPSTFYDWTLAPSGAFEPGFVLPKDAQNRLLIERFSSKVTEALYRNRSDPVGLAGDNERSTLTKILSNEYEEVERRLQFPDSCMLPFCFWLTFHVIRSFQTSYFSKLESLCFSQSAQHALFSTAS